MFVLVVEVAPVVVEDFEVEPVRLSKMVKIWVKWFSIWLNRIK